MKFKVVVYISWNEIFTKNSNDTRNITLSNRGIRFQFRPAIKYIFIYITKSTCFICVSLLYRNSNYKTRPGYVFVFLISTVPTCIRKRGWTLSGLSPMWDYFRGNLSLKLFLAHFQFKKFQPYMLFHSPRKHLRNKRGKINCGRITDVQWRGRRGGWWGKGACQPQ